MKPGAVLCATPLCLALACAGCAPPAATPPPSPPSNAQWRMALSLTPVAPRQLDPTQFHVQVSDSHGRPVSGASVTFCLVMPAMNMGQNRVTAQAGAAGIYTATGRFTMPGRWQATVQAGKGALHQTQSFAVTVS